MTAYEGRHLTAEPLAGLVVEPGVLPGEDAAEPGLVRGGLEAAEGPGDAVERDRQVYPGSVEGAEHGGRGLADGAVRARVRRVGRGDGQRVPVLVPPDGRVVDGV